MNKKYKILIVITLLIIICLSIYSSIYFISFINNPTLFRNWIDSFGIFSNLIFFAIVIIQILIPYIPGEPIELIAGYAFGEIKGTIICILAEGIASILVVYLVKKYGKKFVEYFFEKEKLESLNFIKNSKIKVMFYSILFILPGTPKDLLCYFIGLTDINITTSFIITTLCRIPSIVTSTLVGDSLGDERYLKAIILFIVTSLISLLGILLFNKLANKKTEN